MCENVVYKSFVATDQGRRDYMEDFVCISRQQQMNENKRNDNNFTVKCRENSIEYFAVFDGHGGSDAASFAQNYLLSEISKQTGFWSQDRRSVSNSITEGFISTTKAMWRVYGECIKVLMIVMCAVWFYDRLCNHNCGLPETTGPRHWRITTLLWWICRHQWSK